MQMLDLACNHLGRSDGHISATRAHLSDVEVTVNAILARLDQMDGGARTLSASLDTAHSTAKNHADQLSQCQQGLANLHKLHDEAEGRARQLKAAHDETAIGLRAALDLKVDPVVEQVAMERKRLDEHIHSTNLLEIDFKKAEQDIAQLQADGRSAADEIMRLDNEGKTLASRTQDLQAGLQSAEELAKADRQQLHDALGQVGLLHEGAGETTTLLQRTRHDLSTVRADAMKRGTQVDRVLDNLTSLRDHLNAIDVEVEDMRVLIRAPRSH